MCRTLTYSVTDKDAGVEILDFLRSHGFLCHLLSSMKNDPGCICLNEDRGFGHTLLKEGDILTILLREMDPPSLISPVKMDLQILFEDQDLLVLNKPADMPVHPSAGNYENTLANGVSYYFASKEQPFVYRCINRLDRDTSRSPCACQKCSQCSCTVPADESPADQKNVSCHCHRDHTRTWHHRCSHCPRKRICPLPELWTSKMEKRR